MTSKPAKALLVLNRRSNRENCKPQANYGLRSPDEKPGPPGNDHRRGREQRPDLLGYTLLTHHLAAAHTIPALSTQLLDCLQQSCCILNASGRKEPPKKVCDGFSVRRGPAATPQGKSHEPGDDWIHFATATANVKANRRGRKHELCRRSTLPRFYNSWDWFYTCFSPMILCCFSGASACSTLFLHAPRKPLLGQFNRCALPREIAQLI